MEVAFCCVTIALIKLVPTAIKGFDVLCTCSDVSNILSWNSFERCMLLPYIVTKNGQLVNKFPS